MSHEFEGKTCCERVSSAEMWGREHRCGKAVKGLNSDGKPVCDVHLADAARHAEESAYRDEVEATLAAASIRWKGCSFENKTVTLEWAELQRLIEVSR